MQNGFKTKVISFYTKEYTEEAARLIRSLTNWKLDYEVEQINSLGSWLLNVNHKASFIKEKLLKHKKPVVWLDADSEVVRYPKYFDIIEEDLGVCYNKFYRLNSATMFFNYNENTLMFLDRFIANCRKNTSISDQEHLENSIRGDFGERHKVNIFFFPFSYCHIFDLHKDWNNPVIVEYQASRKYRKVTS